MKRESTMQALRIVEGNLEGEIRGLDAQKAERQSRLDAVRVAMREVERLPDDAVAVPQPGTHRHNLTAEVYDILNEERPLHRRVLLDRVRSRGVYVGGENPMNTFGSYLSQDKRFVSVGKGVWTLAEEPPARSPNGSGATLTGGASRELTPQSGEERSDAPT